MDTSAMNTRTFIRLLGWWLVLLVVIAIWGPSAQAQESTETDTLAVSTLESIARDGRHEFAGVIIRGSDGALRVTTPTRANEEDFRLHIALLAGERLAGIYHTHPSRTSEAQVFSHPDIAVADQLHVPSYVLFEKTGEVRKYIPHQTQLQNQLPDGTAAREAVAIGDKV